MGVAGRRGLHGSCRTRPRAGHSMTVGKGVVILGALRTPIRKYGGSRKDIAPTNLGAFAAREAIMRAGIDPKDAERHARQPAFRMRCCSAAAVAKIE
jgi:acetyl-CoA acetyltransferase